MSQVKKQTNNPKTKDTGVNKRLGISIVLKYTNDYMVYLFNTNIVPSPAVVRVSEIPRELARDIINKTAPDNVISAIGHEATANCMSEILGIVVKPNRINAQPKQLDVAISLKLNGRIEEGKVLTLEDMEKIGYTLYFMEFYDLNCPISQL